MSYTVYTAVIVWAPVPFDSKYRVSNTGVVQRRGGLYNEDPNRWYDLKQDTDKDGYKKVTLRQNSRKYGKHYHVHRLVLLAHVGPCPPGYQARHFPDRDPSNNNLCNLSWDTRNQNCKDKVIHGTHPKGSRDPNSKLTETNIPIIRQLAAGGLSDPEIAKQFGVTPHSIYGIRHGLTWAHV